MGDPETFRTNSTRLDLRRPAGPGAARLQESEKQGKTESDKERIARSYARARQPPPDQAVFPGGTSKLSGGGPLLSDGIVPRPSTLLAS